MLPFTTEQFFAAFEAFNRATWPAPVLAYLAGAVALAAALRGGMAAGRIVAWLLAALWAFTGIAYHAAFFAAINPAAWLFGGLFLIQAALLAAEGWRGSLAFRSDRSLPLAAGLSLVAYAALLYPLLGAWAGHRYPAAPVFGITPCPLVIFTCGLLLLARGPVPRRLFAVPIVWSLIGGSAAVLLGVPQDGMLPAAGLLLLALSGRRPVRTAA